MSRHTEQQIAALEARVAALEDAADAAGTDTPADPDDDDGAPDGPYREERGGGWWRVFDADGNAYSVQGDDESAELLASLS